MELGAGAGPRCCCELLLCFLQVKLSMSLVGGDPKILGSKTGAFQ